MNLLEGKKGVDEEECMKTITEEVKIREKMEGNREVYALFIDMKAAFDKVNRSKLWEIMEKRDLCNGLI